MGVFQRDCFECGKLCQDCNKATQRTCEDCGGGYCIKHNDGSTFLYVSKTGSHAFRIAAKVVWIISAIGAGCLDEGLENCTN